MNNNIDSFVESGCEEVFEERPEVSEDAAVDLLAEKASEGEPLRDEPWDGFRTDAEADGDALASAGFGTDEDYCHDSCNSFGE